MTDGHVLEAEAQLGDVAHHRKNTAPEIALRRFLHVRGFRFRVHRKDLPGCPDIVLPKYHTAVLVTGVSGTATPARTVAGRGAIRTTGMRSSNATRSETREMLAGCAPLAGSESSFGDARLPMSVA